MKVSVMPLGKPLSRAKVKGSLEWMVEEEEEKFQLWPWDPMQHQGLHFIP